MFFFKFLFAFALVFTIVNATNIFKSPILFKPLSQAHVDYINSLNTTWKAGHNFKGLKIEDLKTLCGTILEYDNSSENFILSSNDSYTYKLPEEFDSRKQWPECADVISHIRDQGSCGSCWAVSTASAITDRVCIASNGKNKTQLSAQDITSCCGISCAPSGGCLGGFPIMAWNFWVKKGLVTGGDYGDKNTCLPYLLQPCEHHTDGPRKKCGDIVHTPSCPRKCLNESINYKEDKNFGESALRSSNFNSVPKIKIELSKRGTMGASMEVYDDFLLYKEGIYTKTPGAKLVGGHAISVIGWGKENDVEYWLAKNNWNNDWGMEGYFKIKIGEAGINHGFTAGIARK